MAKRNQVTTDLRISADAQLKNSRSFINQLDKLIDKFDFGDKINNQLSGAKSQLKEYNKILEKVQSKTLISDDELKDLVKAGKEIANIVTKTEKLYSNLSTNELQKFSKEYINKVKAQEEAIAKIKNEYATKTGKNFDKELANYDKLSAKVKALEKEKVNLMKNGAAQVATKEIEQLNQKLEEQKNKLIEIKKIQQSSANAYTSTVNAESKKRGYNNYNDIKNIKIQSEDQIRKQLGNVEYKQRANIISEINREIKSIEKNKKDSNGLDKAAIELARKYKIENVSTLDSLKQQVKLKRDILNTYKNNKSELADEKLVTSELERQNKILEDRNAIEKAGKTAELRVIQQGGYTSKASLTATGSATNRSITNIENQLTESGIENITNNAAQLIASQIGKLNTEIAKGNQDLSAIDETNKKLATQSERTNNEQDITAVGNNIRNQLNETEGDVNDHTTIDNDRIANNIVKLGISSQVPYGKEIKGIAENVSYADGDDDFDQLSIDLKEYDRLSDKLENVINEIKIGSGSVEEAREAAEDFGEVFDSIVGITLRNFQKIEDELYKDLQAGDLTETEYQDRMEKITNQKSDFNRYQMTAGNRLDSIDAALNPRLRVDPEVFESIAKESNNASKSIARAAEQSQYLGSTFDDLKNKVGYFLSMNYVFDQLTRKIREASDFTKNLDKDMTQIGLVLGQTSSQTWKNFDTYSQMADRLNTTVSDVTASMKLFYQQGLNTVEVNKMVEASAIAAALGESTMAEASETLTSIINSYNLTASQAIKVTDKISMVAMVSAADFGELSTAIEKVASSAASAGLDLDHMMGYLGKMIETTREAPTNIGTALKTIVANFTQFKEDPSGLNETGSEINKVDKALKSVNISLTDSTGEVRDLSDVLDDLGKKWSGLTRNQKSYLATQIAGTRQQSRFYALMNDYGRTLELVGEAANSDGKATSQFALYQNSLTASTERLNNEWEKFYNNILKNDTGLKTLKNGMTALLKIANQLGPVLTTVFGMGLLKGTRKLFVQFQKTREELRNLNQEILSTERISARALIDKNPLEGYNFNGRQNNNKGLNKATNNFGSSIAQSLFEKKGGNEQIEKLKELQNLQEIINSNDRESIENNAKLIESTLGKTAGQEALNGALSQTTKVQMAETVQTQAETVAHTASASVKWAEVAAQVALNLAIMAGIAVVGLIVAGVVKAINAQHEHTLQMQEEAKAARENYKQLEELANSYLEVSSRINKTSQEKEELQQVTQDLLEQYPELIAYIDSEGKAYAKTASEIKKYMAEKKAETITSEKNAAIATLNDKSMKTNALWDDIFDGVHKENDEKMYGENQKSARDNLINAFNNLESSGVNGGTYRTVTRANGKQESGTLQHFIKQEDYKATEDWLNQARDAANKEIERLKKLSSRNISDEDRKKQIDTQENRLSSITSMEKSIKNYDAAVKKDLGNLAEKIYADTIANQNFSDEKSALAKNVLSTKTKNALKDKNANEIADYLQSNEYTDLQNNIIEQLNKLNNSEIIALEDLQEKLATDTEISFSEAKNKIEDMKKRVPAAAELLDEQLKDYEDLVKQLTNGNDTGRKNIEGLKLSTLNLLSDAKNNMKGDTSSGFNEAEFNKIYGQILNNEAFLKDLNKLDTSNLGEVQNFKRKYAQMLGQYGQDFLNELVKNPEYDAQKTSETLNSAMSMATGKGTTVSGSSMSDVISGQSQEGAFNILSSEDETRAQNLLILGNKLVVSAEEINSSYKKAFEDISNYTTQVTEEAQNKIDDNVNKIRNTLNNQNWKIGDKIDFSSLTDAEKDTIKTSQKAISNLQKQIDTAEELRKKYSQLSVEQQANVDYAPFRNGIIATQNMVNELSNLADIYDVVTNKEYTQLDLVNWIANDTSGQLLAALEVENGQLALNANSMEYLAEAHKQEAISAIDAQINKLEGQLVYLDGVDECTEAELEDIKDVNDAQNKLTENLGTNIQTSSNNLATWVQNWANSGSAIGKTINFLINKFNNLFKAETQGNGDTSDNGGVGTANINTSIDTNDEKIDIESRKQTIRDNIEKLKALRTGLEKTNGKDLLKGINKIGSYGGGSDKDKFDPVEDELEKFYNYLRKIEKIEAKLTQMRSKRSLIDQGKNYYIEDLKQENELLTEQQKLYRSYINDESAYLQELRNQLEGAYSQWVSFNEEGVIQVKQTEFVANSEEEQAYLEEFMDLQQKYQDEYNTRESNKNKLLEIENTQLENIKTMYEKILARVTDVNEAIQRQVDLLDHDITMSFSNIAKFDIMDDKMAKAVEGIKNSYSYINDFEKQVSELNKQVKNGPFAELLLWDEALEIWRVNEEKLNDPAIISKYEKLGYNWQDIDTYVRSVAVKSQSISDSMKETVDSAHEFAETLKGLIDDRISAIQDYYSASTDELNKIFDTFDRKMTDVDNQNNLFGVASASLEDKYLTLVTATAVLKQTIEQLKANKAGILAEIQKEYPEYINMINGMAVVNKQAIEESANLTDKQKAELLQLYGVLEASEDQIKDLEDKLVDYFNTMLEMEEAKRDAIIELKQSVHDELIARDQEEIDNLRSKYDKMSQLDQEYYSELSQRVNDSRNLRENRQQASDIAQMQARLAILKADNSGTYNAELIDLQRQISDQLQAQADNDIDRELERIQREQQQREEDRQLTISAMENVLTFKDENNWYWQEAQRIWDEGPESVTGFLRSSNEYSNISMEQRALQFEQLTDSMNTAFTTLQTAQGITSEISDGIVSDRSYEEQAKLDGVNSNLSFIQSQINGGEGSLANRIDWSNAKNMEKLDQVILGATNNTGTITTKMQTLYTQNIGPGIKNVKDAITSYLGANSAIWLKINDTKTSLDNTKGDMNSGFDKTVTAAANAATTITTKITEATKEYIDADTRLYNWLNDKYAKENAPVTPSNGNGNTEATKPPTTNGSGNSSASNGGNSSGSNTANTRPDLKVGARISVKPGTRWYYDSYGTSPSGTARGGIIRYTNLKGSHPYNIEGLGWIRRQDIVGYSKGGYVDYTGVANVHGTQTEPEAFLNAKQTRLFEGLRDSLVRGANKTYNKEDKEITKEEYNIDNISIEVKQIADVDAIDKVTKRVKEEIYKDAMSNKNNMAVRRR